MIAEAVLGAVAVVVVNAVVQGYVTRAVMDAKFRGIEQAMQRNHETAIRAHQRLDRHVEGHVV